MDAFFNKLSEFIRSIDSIWDDISKNRNAKRYDADYEEALDELDEYLKTGHTRAGRNRTSSERSWEHSSEPSGNESLKQDYANLELAFGASFAEVKKSYKRLIKKYHPDRFINDPEKQSVATEITQKLNTSFQNIRASQPDH